MSEQTIHQTAPEDRISHPQKIIYGLGGLCNNLLPAAIGCMGLVLNLGLHMDPRWIGFIFFLPRLVDAIIDPVMGYITDHTKSRWGRRKPYIFLGAIFSGVIYALMWQVPGGLNQSFYVWFFTLASIVFYIAYTVYAAPLIALGYEMTPDYHERTRLLGVFNFVGQFAWAAIPWFWAIVANPKLFDTPVAGAHALAIGVGVFVAIVGTAPALFIKERFYAIAQAEDKDPVIKKSFFEEAKIKFSNFFKTFFVTLKNWEFLKLCIATFAVFNGFNLIAGLGNYIIMFYVMGGDQAASGKYIGLFGTVSSLGTFCVIPLVTWISTKVGKKKAFYIAMSIAIVGYIAKWFCYKPGSPLLILWAAPAVSFALGGLFTLVGSMMADLCDVDELNNGQRREGMFGAVYWWVVKLGLAFAMLLSGYLLNWTGFNEALGAAQPARALFLMRVFEIGISVVTVALAMWAIASYSVTEEKAREVRAELERRRGKATA